jgi:hypothetical protein
VNGARIAPSASESHRERGRRRTDNEQFRAATKLAITPALRPSTVDIEAEIPEDIGPGPEADQAVVLLAAQHGNDNGHKGTVHGLKDPTARSVGLWTWHSTTSGL